MQSKVLVVHVSSRLMKVRWWLLPTRKSKRAKLNLKIPTHQRKVQRAVFKMFSKAVEILSKKFKPQSSVPFFVGI